MALARYSPFFRLQADRLFGSVVRYWVSMPDSGEIAWVVFACGCHWSARALRQRRFCNGHRGQAGVTVG